MRTADDYKKTTLWAIARVKMVALAGSAIHFKLGNRETGRAHNLYFGGLGMTFGVDAKLPFTSGNLKYRCFRTRHPVSFDDFHGVAARVSGAKVNLGIGYAKSYLTIWPGSAHFDDPLAYISMSGWSVGRLAISGQAANYGVLSLEYTSGKRGGVYPMEWITDIGTKQTIERITRVSSKAQENPLLGLPSDVLFDFDSWNINPAADHFLREAKDVIELRDRGRVVISGHTDAKGSTEYNKTLSMRRAQAVKNWMVQHRVHNAHEFEIKGFGEEKPVAPNTLPDGQDNPEGRRENRRVEVSFHY